VRDRLDPPQLEVAENKPELVTMSQSIRYGVSRVQDNFFKLRPPKKLRLPPSRELAMS